MTAYYWSSTTYESDTSNAWLGNFYSGQITRTNKSADNIAGTVIYVRAVRGGPCRSEGDWCLEDIDCDDGVYCNGTETCVDGSCQAGTAPCTGDTPFCDEAGDTCVECFDNSTCDDGLHCNGVETCAAGACQDGTAPSCTGDTPFCDEAGDTCVECLVNGDCDDSAYCNGAETCTAGACLAGTPVVCDDENACNGVEMRDYAMTICNVCDPAVCWHDGDVLQRRGNVRPCNRLR